MKTLKKLLKVGLKAYGIWTLAYMCVIGCTEFAKAGYYNPDRPALEGVWNVFSNTIKFWRDVFKES